VFTVALRADVSPIDESSSSIQEENDQGSKQGYNRRGFCIIDQKCNRRSKGRIKGILLQSIHNSEKGRGFKTSTGSEKIKRIYRRKELLNGITGINLQTSNNKGLYDIFRSRRCISTHTYPHIMSKIPEVCLERQKFPIRSTTFRPIPESVEIYEDTETSNTLGQEFGNPNGCISGRPDNIRRVEGNMLKEHRSSFQQTYGTGIQNQALQVIPDSIPVNSTLRYNHQHEINVPQGNICQDQGSKKRRSETHQHQEYLNKELRIVHWKILVNVNSSLAWTSNATQNTRAKELFSQRNRRQAEDLERSMFPTRKSRPRGIHGRQRPCMGNSDCFRFLFWFMEFYRKVEAHQREGVDRCLQSLMPTPISRPFSSDIFRQYNYNGVRQEIWRNNIQRTIRDRGRDVKTLLGNKATTSNIIHSVIDQSGRCSKQTYSPDGMVSIRLSIQQALIDLRPSRCRSIRITFKQKDRPILQLVQGENHNRPEFSNAQLENLEESLLLPTVESNFSDSTENISREDNSNDSKPILEIGDMVPNNNANGNDAPDNDICHRSYTRSKKRKISALEEQGMEANCMESQWSTIETQGLKEYAADILFNNKRRIRHDSQYSAIQQRFLDWKISREISVQISSIDMINFLAEASKTEKWKSTTIRSYKSAIINLAQDPESISEDPLLK
ncbi:hypothetical protein AYI68_g4476, partial [Smittium mucronatum]